MLCYEAENGVWIEKIPAPTMVQGLQAVSWDYNCIL